MCSIVMTTYLVTYLSSQLSLGRYVTHDLSHDEIHNLRLKPNINNVANYSSPAQVLFTLMRYLVSLLFISEDKVLCLLCRLEDVTKLQIQSTS
jgi:hypothetical protein